MVVKIMILIIRLHWLIQAKTILLLCMGQLLPAPRETYNISQLPLP